MDELKDSKLKRPMDRSVIGNDAAALDALVRTLNNPVLTGAEVPPEELQPGRLPGQPHTAPRPSEPEPQLDPVHQSPPPPVRQPTAALPTKLFLTGQPRSGKSHIIQAIGAAEFELSGPAKSLVQFFFGPGALELPGGKELLLLVTAWGNGEVNSKYPISAARACFVDLVRRNAGSLPGRIPWPGFGTNEGFWIDSLLTDIYDYQLARPNATVAVTGITTNEEFVYFRSQGFSHWHIIRKSNTPPVPDPLASALDNDVIRQTSQKRSGNKLHCIWNDNTPGPERLWTTDGFVALAMQSQQAAVNTGE